MTDCERERIWDKVEDEGLEYCFRAYSSFEDVKDPEFHRLRQAFIDAADALEAYISDE